MLETPDLNVTPDIGPVTDHHMLVFPKSHFTSYASCPDNFADQLDFVCQTVKEKTGASDYFMFEHGTGKIEGEQTGCGNSVYHAHLHILPIKSEGQISVLDQIVSIAMNEGNFKMQPVFFKEGDRDIIPVLKEVTKGSPYLLIKQGKHGFVLVETEQIKVPSQFLRKVCADILEGNGSFWNWKEMTEIERLMVLSRLNNTYGIWQP